MTASPTVALCIPTYQRSSCLTTLLESALAQSPPFDQIVISDDASGDDTEEVVAGFSERFPAFIYFRSPVNMGLDQNFRKVVELASTDFVWFMGDDDRLRPNAVQAFHDALAGFPKVVGITFASVDYDSDLRHPTGLKDPPPTAQVEGAETLFSHYVELLGFMSTTVVRRSAWNAVHSANIGRFDNLYSQVHRIGLMMADKASWLISSALVVDYRSDNDQFKTTGGELSRLMRDVHAYRGIIADLFAAESPTFSATMDRVLRTHIISRARNGKTREPQFPWASALNQLTPIYRGHLYYWRMIVPTLLTPMWLLRPLRALYKSVSSTSGSARARQFEAKSKEAGTLESSGSH